MHQRKRGDDTLIGRLLECHDRIREMLAMGAAIEQLGSEEDATAVAERLGRYFTRGLRFHTRDEDESILPRLVAPELAVPLERMHREHLDHEPLVQKVVGSCRDLFDAPARWQELTPVVAGAAEALMPAMVSHLLQEERDLFPAIERLDADVQASILAQMDARRAAGR